MARGLRLWGAIALAACGIVAVVYLPPRGGVTAPESRFAPRVPQPTAARLRAQGLAEQWRAARASAQLVEHRERSASLPTHVPDDGASFTAVVTGIDSIPPPPAATAMVRSALDSAWHRLGLGATKVSVEVIVELLPRGSRFVGTPAFGQEGPPIYQFPDTTDRASCTVLIPAGAYWTRILLGQQWPYGEAANVPRLGQWLQGGLGPCAFYASFGNPGKPVRYWLARRNFDLALYPVWDTPGRPQLFGLFRDPASKQWWWDWVYNQSLTAVGCLARRPSACRAAVLEGDEGGLDDSVPRIVTLGRWWWKGQRLVAAERYLSDVVREVGHDRFLRFWNSPQPVDTALAVALRMPLGEWTAGWERRFAPRLPLGPAAPLSGSLLAVLLAAAAVASVALTARRRQVR